MVIKKNLSSFRAIKSGDAVKECGLASTVRSNDAVNAMFLDLDVQTSTAISPPKFFVTFLAVRRAIGFFY